MKRVHMLSVIHRNGSNSHFLCTSELLMNMQECVAAVRVTWNGTETGEEFETNVHQLLHTDRQFGKDRCFLLCCDMCSGEYMYTPMFWSKL